MKVDEGVISRVLNGLMKKLEKMQDANWQKIHDEQKIKKLVVQLAHDINKKYPKK